MDIEDLQRRFRDSADSWKNPRTKQQRFITLVEEVGELARAMLIEQHCHLGEVPNTEEELMDVLGNTLLLFYEFGINIPAAITRKLG